MESFTISEIVFTMDKITLLWAYRSCQVTINTFKPPWLLSNGFLCPLFPYFIERLFFIFNIHWKHREYIYLPFWVLWPPWIVLSTHNFHFRRLIANIWPIYTIIFCSAFMSNFKRVWFPDHRILSFWNHRSSVLSLFSVSVVNWHQRFIQSYIRRLLFWCEYTWYNYFLLVTHLLYKNCSRATC